MNSTLAAQWLRTYIGYSAAVVAVPAILFWFRSTQQGPVARADARPAYTASVSTETLAEGSRVTARLRRKSPLALADPATAHKAAILPAHQEQIARIDAELDRSARKMMEAELERWEKRGGFHGGPLPSFSNPLSKHAQKLAEMRREAEGKIREILSPEEKARWEELSQRDGNPAAPKGTVGAAAVAAAS